MPTPFQDVLDHLPLLVGRRAGVGGRRPQPTDELAHPKLRRDGPPRPHGLAGHGGDAASSVRSPVLVETLAEVGGLFTVKKKE